MVYSMTAFARGEAQTNLGGITLEIRSVNNRFLDLNFRLSDLVRGMELQLREQLNRKLNRGRVDLSIRVDASGNANAGALNHEAVSNLKQIQEAILQSIPGSQALTVGEVLSWPGVVQGADAEQAAESVMPLLDITLKDFLAARKREGDKLADVIRERINACAKLVDELKKFLPEINTQIRERLESRVEEFRERLDEDRIEQEVVLLLNKSDVEEEIDRLEIHFEEVKRVLGQKQPVGRRLDFLMQELNREANTLGSKAAHKAVTDTSMELKVLIEQMREQVQNLE